MDKKTEIREEMKQFLKNVNKQREYIKVKQIHESLFRHVSWQSASRVAVTVSGEIEIETRTIIQRAWEEGKTVAVPKCLPKTKRLDFRGLQSFQQLETVFYGLKEPKIEETSSIERASLDLVIVPGLAFDRQGYRIGFGGGYYDRFLQGVQATKLALAYDEQIYDVLPHESHDIPVDVIVTPTKVMKC
ncbi:5-formyltetrahydrofolate cyclo-ligase [Pullulanibacillus pueri]|uniref:5-formyltetrahydrofolate cyclo-ligase n=1 Tax=Pullulanibacillus pueri TaxID=1437324 RepID=A0A8J2ZVN3_9BACL|nr:5-formyltetrahydrofolate cyclo-ligase [Pullulanibacillus pueri]MBM7681538.1 5-formyltetrahydrofolate cyclo-ligase [Pullulanibacillus pueri]GGH79758.1 hypothetical protein GCM10007096_15160 [Pullulanibacillus pueri]